jgi:hypothetical protein
VLERIAPLAERADVKLGMEIHAPLGVDSPWVVGVRECYERIDSPYLGFIPDFSATMTAVPAGQLKALEAAGLSVDALDVLLEQWASDGAPHERFAAFADRAAALGSAPEAIAQARVIFSMFGRQDPRMWTEILPQVVHVHAKFYELDADGEEPSIPYADVLPVFDGFDGYLSSEWEGYAFYELDDVAATEMVRRHHELCRRHLAAVGT